MKDIKPFFRTGKYRDFTLKVKIFRRAYPYSNPTKEFEALFIQVGRKGFWIFRNKEIWEQWPCQA